MQRMDPAGRSAQVVSGITVARKITVEECGHESGGPDGKGSGQGSTWPARKEGTPCSLASLTDGLGSVWK